MTKCFKCNKEIKYLKAYSEVVNNFEIDEQGNSYCFGNDHLEGFLNFECPECCEELFTDEIQATKFLKGEGEFITKLN